MRSIVTSEKSRSKIFFVLSKVTLTDARPARGKSAEPFQIKSSPRLPRILLTDCSPRTKRKSSATFDLPEPFGPTMTEMGESNSKIFFFAKDLNPESSIDLRYISLPIFSFERLAGGFLFRILLGLALSLTTHFVSNRNCYSEMFIVVRPRFAYGFVHRSHTHMLLGFFLETTLRIYPITASKHFLHQRRYASQNKLFGNIISLVKINGANDSFQSIGKNILARPTSIFRFSFGK